MASAAQTVLGEVRPRLLIVPPSGARLRLPAMAEAVVAEIATTTTEAHGSSAGDGALVCDQALPKQ